MREVLVGLAGVAFGVAFVVKPRWWAQLCSKPTPWTERQVAAQAVCFFVVGLLLVGLMSVVFVSRVI